MSHILVALLITFFWTISLMLHLVVMLQYKRAVFAGYRIHRIGFILLNIHKHFV